MLSDTIEQRQAEEKTLRSNRILRTMVEGAHALVRATTEDELFQNMCRVIVETGGYRMAWVGQVEHDEEKSIRPLAHAGHEAGYLALAKISWGDSPHGRGPSGLSVRTGATQFNNDITVNPGMGPWKELALERRYLSSISLPLRNKACVFGALTIYAGEPNAFGPEEVALFEELAEDVSYGATALHTRRAHDEMEETLRLVEQRRQAEESLRKSEERYRLLVEQAEDGIFLSDAAGRYVDVNTAGHKMLGYTRDEILSLTIADVIAPEEVSRIAPEVGRFADGQVARSEWRFRRKDGSEIVGEVVGRQLPDGHLLAILRDVTERKKVEEALIASEERLQLALGAGHMGIWEWDLATGACVWNEETYRALGYEPGSVTPSFEAWAQRLLPEDLAQTEARLREMVERGGQFSAEYRVLGEKGEVRWLEGRGQRVVDKEGRASRAIGVIVDITARKQADEALRQAKAEDEFRLLAEAMPQIVWATRADGWNIFFNRQWVEYTGLTLEESYGHGWNKPFHPDDQQRAWDAWQNAVKNSGTYSLECRLRRADGEYRWWLVRGVPLVDENGKIVKWFGTCTDIHELIRRKQVESDLRAAKAEADRSSLAKSKFLAAASHDLRQPAQSLSLLLSVIRSELPDTPIAAEAMSLAQDSLSSLNGMLAGILDLSRLDAGVVAPNMSSLDLGEFVYRLASEYRPRAVASGLVLRVAPRDLHASTDTALLERILRNLIENALRYTEKGGILIGLRQRGDRIRLDVIDTGMGIPAEQQTEIFEEFRQLHNPARDSSKGLGLGLAIVARLARLLGAEVQVSSRLGRGTRFSLLLPRDRSAPVVLPVKPTLADPGGRVLLIEDNANERAAYELMLSLWGYETLSAASGEEALDRGGQENWRVDAVIADHRLGAGLTGAGAAAEIARRAGRSVPTMLVTGDTAPERLAEASNSGFVLLHKPVEADDLRQKLANLLREGNRKSS